MAIADRDGQAYAARTPCCGRIVGLVFIGNNDKPKVRASLSRSIAAWVKRGDVVSPIEQKDMPSVGQMWNAECCDVCRPKKKETPTELFKEPPRG